MRLWQSGMIFLARNQPVKNFMQNRATMSELASRFVGGRDAAAATQKSRALKLQGRTASLFYLGEYVEDLAIINQTVATLKLMAHNLADFKLDVHISVDPTQIGHQLNPEICHQNAFEIAQAIKSATAGATGAGHNFIMLDMEDSAVTAATIELYQALRAAGLPAAITLQAYLFRTEADLQNIIQREGGIVRLVKGAFAEGNQVALTHRADIDRNFLKLTEAMFSDEAHRCGFYPIFATHDDRLIETIIQLAGQRGWQPSEYEFEMLYGVRTELQEKLVQQGQQLRLYLPFGVDWWPYAVRRVGESPKNAKFLLRSLFAV